MADGDLSMFDSSNVQVIEWNMLDKVKFLPFSVASVLAVRGLVYPLTVIKTRIQVQHGNEMYRGTFQAFRQIYRNEGWRGLYRGFLINGCQVFSSLFYLTAYEKSREILLVNFDIKNHSLRSLIAGGCASAVSQLILVPFDVISQHMMVLERRKGTNNFIIRNSSSNNNNSSNNVIVPPSNNNNNNNNSTNSNNNNNKAHSTNSSTSTTKRKTPQERQSASTSSLSSSSTSSNTNHHQKQNISVARSAAAAPVSSTTAVGIHCSNVVTRTNNNNSNNVNFHTSATKSYASSSCSSKPAPSTYNAAGGTDSLNLVAKLEKNPNLRLAPLVCREIYRKDGLIRGFYRGYVASLLIYAPSSAMFWGFYHSYYEYLRSLSPDTVPHLLVQAFAAPLSGATLAVLTNPLDLFRSNLQVHGQGWKKTMKRLYAEDGWAVFHKGLSTRMITIPVSSFLLVVGYEFIKRVSVHSDWKDVVRW